MYVLNTSIFLFSKTKQLIDVFHETIKRINTPLKLFTPACDRYKLCVGVD